MNLRQPYEQLITDKLRKLPAPDADASWQQMKRLLDDDEDTRAGGKRPPGNKGGWWRMGIIALVFMTSLWLYVEKTNTPGTSLANSNSGTPKSGANNPTETKSNASKNTIHSNKNQTAIIDNTSTPPVSTANTATRENKETGNTTVDNSTAAGGIKDNTVLLMNKAVSVTAGKDVQAFNLKAGNTPPAGSGITEDSSAVKPLPLAANKNSFKKNAIITPGTDNHSVAAGIRSPRATERTANSGVLGNDKEENSLPVTGTAVVSQQNNFAPENSQAKRYQGKNKGDNIPAHDGGNDKESQLTTSDYVLDSPSSPAKENNWFERLNALKILAPIPSYNTSLLAGDKLESGSTVNNIINNQNKKLAAKAQREQAAAALAKKEKRSFHLNLSNVFKPFSLQMDAEPRWAAGIALNSGITVNAQSRFNYNMNGKSGTLSDYIPSPYLQFHLNNYVYMQTELNFITPQYTPQLLIYQQNTLLAAQGMSQQKSIFIQKLYYFNLPLSLHYSPVNNLYLAGGIQFSSFQSGLVSIQEKQYDTQSGPANFSSVNNSIIKFKDDSIAAKLTPNEWRWQTGADYYWNRFTLGMRYNKSFKDLLNVNVSGSLPPTTTRNASFLFFMRYNLFESKKKDNSEQQRSLTRF